jgi:hypothetical protein
MRVIRQTSFALSLTAIAVLAAHAAPAAASNPFADMDWIRVSVEVGGPLDRAGSIEPELLAGDLRRFNVFQSGLRRALVSQIESCGLLVDQGGTDEISVEVFGRPERRSEGGPPQYVFLVEVRAVNLEAARGTDADLVPPKRVLGLAEDANLESALVDAALAALPDDLQGCEEP